MHISFINEKGDEQEISSFSIHERVGMVQAYKRKAKRHL